MDFEKAKLNPAAVFKSPQEIVSIQELSREQKIEILCRHTVEELATLIIDTDGKIRAGGKNHDDDAIALAMGLSCIKSAAKLREPRAKKPIAPDAHRWKPVSAWT